MLVVPTLGGLGPSEADNNLRNPVTDKSVGHDTTPTATIRPTRPAQKKSSKTAEPNIPGPATRPSGRKRPTKSQGIVPEPEAPSSRAIPSVTGTAGGKESSPPSRPHNTGTDPQATKPMAAGDDALSTIPSPLLRGLTEEQIQAIVKMVKAQ